MTISMGILTFINVWCVTMFFVFAFSVKEETHPSELDYPAAPKAFPWKKKLLLNTWISLGITLVIAFIIKSGLIPLHTIVDGL